MPSKIKKQKVYANNALRKKSNVLFKYTMTIQKNINKVKQSSSFICIFNKKDFQFKDFIGILIGICCYIWL